MKKFDITGMSCAACAARVEKAVGKLENVERCSVNLLTNSMTVEGNASADEIIGAVVGAGYGASEKTGRLLEIEAEIKRSSVRLGARLTVSVILLLALMYVSMGVVMLSAPVPSFISGSPTVIAVIQLTLCAAVMLINVSFFVSGIKAAINLAPNMDTLVALGSFSAFVYSLYASGVIAWAESAENIELAHKYLHELYFEAAAMILALVTVGKMLQSIAKGKTADALRALTELSPQTATVIRSGTELTVPVDQVVVGDVFSVRPGQSIPADGLIIDGSSAVDESMLTGESIPVDKSVNDAVCKGTINTSGFLKCRVTAVGEDTALSKIIKMVTDAQEKKAPIARLADKTAGIFVPVVLIIALITLITWLLLGQTVGFALARAISVLVISCPCSLGLATPVAVMVGSGVGAKHGILFKSGAALENTGRAKTVVLDKTGTITEGKPCVTDILPFSGYTDKQLLALAYSLEAKSEHPLARAIAEYSEQNGVKACECTDFVSNAGKGVSAQLSFLDKQGTAIGGSLEYVLSAVKDEVGLSNKGGEFALLGKTPVVFAFSGEIVGMIALSDSVKSDSKTAVSSFKNLGMKVVMLTGDNGKTAKAIAKKVGIQDVIYGVLPDGKLAAVEQLKANGKVIMVGDGVNDAPALATADIGMAIGTGTDVAIESADVVLMKSTLCDAVNAVKLSKKTLKNIKQNLFWAFFYNTLGIPIAAGVLTVIGITLSPMIGAAAMSLSSVCVVCNALRLNFIKFDKYDVATEDNDMFGKNKNDNTVELKISGMMCPHCEARVQKALQAVQGVEKVTVSHKKGNAVVQTNAPVSLDILKNAVKDQGYEVLN